MLSESELQYYYHGFYRVLKRYRATSILGWLIVFAGVVSVPFGWKLGRTTGFIEVVLTLLTILAGLTVVWQNISALDEYIHVPFPLSTQAEMNEQQTAVLSEIRNLMKEVDDGGWQEAYAAIGKLKEMQTKFGLPELKD